MKTKENDHTILTSRNYATSVDPFVTVLTPIYNRRATLQRTIDSVKNQTLRDIEYILIDDGSTESVDDIVKELMKSTDIPVMYIKKSNGGVHTARNMGYRYARGELVVCIDSDDELLPEACAIFQKKWLSIPEKQREEYWQIKAQCVDQNGNITGSLFPNNINSFDKETARRYFSLAKGEQIGCRVAKIMKKNLFPEPRGVTFVTENIRWVPLEKQYRSYGINDVVRVYHREGDDHLTAKKKKKSKQDLKNSLWNLAYQLNDANTFDLHWLKRVKLIFKYCVLKKLLSKSGDKIFVQENDLSGIFNGFWKRLLWGPSVVIARVYGAKMRM